MMRCLLQLWLLGVALAMLGCRDKLYIADEYVGNDLSDDSASETEPQTHRDEVPGTDSERETETDSIVDTAGCRVPTSFSWSSSEPLIWPPEDVQSVKDPTVVFYEEQDLWLIYASTIAEDLNMTFLSFDDWARVGEVELTPASSNPNLTGYKVAPQLFYFTPRDRWYLLYQTQEPAYSTSQDPSDIMSWSASTRLAPALSLTTGRDYWVICDDTDCYMFFSQGESVLYRTRTAKERFPEGFETVDLVMQDDRFKIFDGCNVYRLAGTDQYLLLVSAIGDNRYYQSWTSDRLDGDWEVLADTEEEAFASTYNVEGADWSRWGIAHGEMLRNNPDETMTIDPCDMRYLYSGLEAGENGGPNESYCIGLLTSDN